MSWARRFLNGVRLVYQVQLRCYFPQLYVLAGFLTVAVFRWTALGDQRRELVPVFLLIEPGTLGFYFVGAYHFLERSQRSLTALSVTPLRNWEFVTTQISVPTAVAAALAIGVWWGTLGFRGPVVPLVLTVGLFCAASSLLGLFTALWFEEFTRFFVGSLPLLLILGLPLLGQIVPGPWAFLGWMPTGLALKVFRSIADGGVVSGTEVVLCTGGLAGYCALGYGLVLRSWERKKWTLSS